MRDTMELGATERVLGRMLNETLGLMDQVSRLGDHRYETGQAGPHERAQALRMAARLARLGGWLLAQDEELQASEGARESARAELLKAERREPETTPLVGPMEPLAARIDGLIAQAVRLDAMMNSAQTDQPSPAKTVEISALDDVDVLLFRPRAANG